MHILQFSYGLRSMLLFAVIFLQASGSLAVERVVVLNPAVSPILQQLELETKIVGVTFNDETFPAITRIGSHLSPNPELIKALQPELLIVGSRRAFPDELGIRLGAQLYRYDPRDLEEILLAVSQLGELFEKSEAAQAIITKQQTLLAELHKIEQPPTVIFEVSQQPLKVAGQQNIVSAIIRAAGGLNAVATEEKHVLLSPEKVLVIAPEVYLYQNGPMNKNPVPPGERSYFKSLKSKVLEVDQATFTRPGLNVFEAVLQMNQLFAVMRSGAKPSLP